MPSCLRTQKSATCWQSLCQCENLLEDTVSIKIIISNLEETVSSSKLSHCQSDWQHLSLFFMSAGCLTSVYVSCSKFLPSLKRIKSVYCQCLCALFQHESISWLAFHVFSYKTSYWKYLMLFWFSTWYFILQEYSWC
jgi:hypothetical protein